MVTLDLYCNLSKQYLCRRTREERTILPNLPVGDSTQIQVLETTDRSTNIGRIVEIGTEEIAFKTDLGLINTIGDEAIFPGVPYIDFAVHF